jgi:site-specific recombinase XerD
VTAADTKTAAPAPVRARARGGAGALALRAQFPARVVPATWTATCLDRDGVIARLVVPPFTPDSADSQPRRRLMLLRMLDWLQAQPGDTWQERWIASGASTDGRIDWRVPAIEWLKQTGRIAADNTTVPKNFGAGLGLLICGDIIRPSTSWLLGTTTPNRLAGELARTRDPGGFAALSAQKATGVGYVTLQTALEQIGIIVAAKGGTVREITVGDCLELMEIRDALADTTTGRKGAAFYQMLHTMGVFPSSAPATMRMLDSRFQGQLTVEQLIDQYAISCRPVRDLLVDYLRERQPGIDYATLKNASYVLGSLFWKDLETHHPGIETLRLPPDIAAAWKQRLATRTVRSQDAHGDTIETTIPRASTTGCQTIVRSFYLDIAQWATEDPARWGPWVASCPIRKTDINFTKETARRKSRMDQRTRERLPVLPVLLATAHQARTHAAELLAAATRTSPGTLFTAAGQTLRRSVLPKPTPRIWAEDPETGVRRDLTSDGDTAFWTWAAIEVLRATGIRIEELTELSHHGLVQYALPTTGETIPLLHIAPSKTDEERLLVVSPELADVLATILHRVRGADGAVPLVIAYDVHEHEFTPPMPVLFQHRIGVDNRPISAATIRHWINDVLIETGLTDASGRPLAFKPHDFRRIFATEAIMNGMPAHICQLLLGHKNINTTMGYKTVYPEEVITGHRAFIARRRELRPSEEYRTPTDEEWEEFLGHFERRKVALGDCGRGYGTQCIHEHSCIRCPLLRVQPEQRPRLIEIRDNLTARITEAKQQSWLGEAEGLTVSLLAANNKLAQLDLATTRRNATTDLGIPSFPEAATRTVTPGQQTP